MKKNIRITSVVFIFIAIIVIIFATISSNMFNSMVSNGNTESNTSTEERTLSPDIQEYLWHEIDYDKITEETGIVPVFDKAFIINGETYSLNQTFISSEAMLIYNYKTENLTNKVLVKQKIHGYSESSFQEFETIKQGYETSKNITLSDGTVVEFYGTDDNTRYIYWQDDNCFYMLDFDYSEPFAELQKFLEAAICHHALDVDV